MVHLKGDNSRTTNSRFPNNFCTICTPPEMAFPTLSARIEEPHTPPCHQVKSMGSRAFELVATTTCQPEVFFCGDTPCGFRNDMLYFHRHAHNFLCSQAITAPMLRRLFHTSA
jgi:hypothetical protein